MLILTKREFSIMPEQIESIVREKPEDYFAILPVHLIGYPCDMDTINSIAKKYNLAVFEILRRRMAQNTRAKLSARFLIWLRSLFILRIISKQGSLAQ